LSGLLKRFESSVGAFQNSIKRLIENHEKFIKALDQGFVVTTEFLRDSTGTDDEDFEELLRTSNETSEVDLYKKEEYYTYFRVLESDDEYFDYFRKRHAFWKMYGLNLPDSVLKKIYYENALKLFPKISKNLFK